MPFSLWPRQPDVGTIGTMDEDLTQCEEAVRAAVTAFTALDVSIVGEPVFEYRENSHGESSMFILLTLPEPAPDGWPRASVNELRLAVADAAASGDCHVPIYIQLRVHEPAAAS